MESRIYRIFLSRVLGSFLSLVLAGGTLTAQAQDEVLDKIVSPDLERREIKEAKLDTEDFEIGFYGGVMNVVDFGSNGVAGVRLAYHVSEDFFTELTIGQTGTDKTSFELLSGATQLLNDDERDLNYYNASIGYNFLPGEVFIGSDWSFNTNLYFIAGVGNTRFAGDEFFTYNLGAGFRFYATDWLTLRLDVRDHVFSHSIFGQEKTAHNLESTLGITLFF